ncbi:uncharacterized protein CcaverHIS019_0407190 [Cutaneotrichosporon cavernicola]|uniref:C2H2-type domain-containing protein n=1 Tax=Cutaneotrichosporon cavernicola TaxID=279322 RepID=A0AA48L4M8_9TREE|nr:uncharacterized protein CcaverHIS019_0407190 [Cutaneotrichosporon cavernicola]BEI91899.1 hypothetical protein CcaverHIS019_0407190 [Cutaneotrichosporon cavernicola]BEI99670.1 hypothetical protein CcaverHIS631_0407130 [Cutaneotrichosporon cavernicola]BEJ07445.1 hypothetical protein CcaverHIS641_0407140 [Cutaneotrichosporon cavernicola]
MESTPEEEGYDPTSRHPLRRIREDPLQPDLVPERQERSDSVSLPGIKALLNAADQPSLMSPFGASFFGGIKSSTQLSTSTLDSPTSRTSRFSSMTSSTADSPGWWAPDDRSSGFSRSSSFSARGGEPDYKRRRSDLPPIPPDADETARLKWQAQSRNASYPATLSGSASGSGGGGGGLRGMLYPPPTMRGSISGTPLTSRMSPDLMFDHHASSRSSPMTGPLSSKFADLHAGERSPPSEAPTPLRARSPTDRRLSLFPRPENTPGGPPHPSAQPGQRLSLTGPPSPEPTAPAPRRSSLAEQIMVQSGDATLAQSGRLFNHDTPHDRDVPYIARRESTESNISATFANHLIQEPESVAPVRDRRAALVAPLPGARRPSFGLVSEDEPETKGDPGMRGMEVLAESARRVADAERKDSMEDDQPAGSPAKPSGGPTGPKYPCQYCKKAFTRPSSLRIHTYSHTGERPYVCPDPTCGRKFSVQSNLKRHAKVHHQNNQQQNAMGNHHARQHPPPGPSMMGRGPPQPGAYGYPGHPPHPAHGPPMPPPHMVHPSHHPHAPGPYGPPPAGFLPNPAFPIHPGPPRGHYRGPIRSNDHHGPPGVPYHVDQRRLSHPHEGSQGPLPRPGPHSGPGAGEAEWETDEEEDELDEDE